MKKTKVITNVLLTCLLLNLPISTHAKINSAKIVATTNPRATEIKDVHIKWLKDNTTLYIGGEIFVQAYTNGSLDNNIVWKIRDLDGKSNIVKVHESESSAKISATNNGRAEIIAEVNDGSYSMRHIVVNVQNYPADEASQSLIGANITPIQSRQIGNGKRLVQVEVKASLGTSKEKVSAMDNYLRKLASKGKLICESINSEHSTYEFYTINIEGQDKSSIEVRVDKNDASYEEISSKLISIHKYNDNAVIETPQHNNEENTSEQHTNKENNMNEEEKSSEKSQGEDQNKEEVKDSKGKYKVPESEATLRLENIIISGGYGDENNPIKIDVKEGLTLKERVAIIQEYISLLNEQKDLTVVQISERKNEIAYKIKVSNRILSRMSSNENINDFYIEIIINKDHKKEYEPIITMLNQLNKDSDIETKTENEENTKISDNKELDASAENTSTNEEIKEENEKVTGNKNTHSRIGQVMTIMLLAIGVITIIKKSKLF